MIKGIKLLPIGKIGAHLWQKGGDWTGPEGPTYESLTWYGKLGYQLFAFYMTANGFAPEDVRKVSNR